MRTIICGRDYAIICSFFLGLSIWIGYPGYVNNYYLYQFKGTYSKTQGLITWLNMGHVGPARSDAKGIDMSVAYYVAGKQYECRKLTWGASAPGGVDSYSYLENFFKNHAPIDVYYDTQHPQNSALLPYVNGDDYAYQIGIGFFIVFLLLVLIYPMKDFRRSFMRF